MSKNTQIQRPTALYKGKILHIESLYTVTPDGKQINKEGVIEIVRSWSRQKELHCPCGCGTPLVLYAGPQRKKRQHFKIWPGYGKKNCHYIPESDESLHSKSALWIWLDYNINSKDIELGKALDQIEVDNRKFQYTLYSPSKKIAVSYCRKHLNLSDEKIKALQDNASDIKTIFVADAKDGNGEDQYPEYLMKIQRVQKYCLLLGMPELSELENPYEHAHLEAIFYAKNECGLWKRISLANGSLHEYTIDSDGSVLFHDQSLLSLYEKARADFDESVKKAIQEQERQKAERKRQEEEEAKRRAELKAAYEKEQERKAQERKQKEQEREQRRLEEEQRRLEREQKRIEREKLRQEKEEARRQKEAEIEEKRKRQEKIDIHAALKQKAKEEYERKIREALESNYDDSDDPLSYESWLSKRPEEPKRITPLIKTITLPADVTQDMLNKSMDQQEQVVKDSTGKRLIKCEKCGKITSCDEFIDYGGINRINLGLCRACCRSNSRQ